MPRLSWLIGLLVLILGLWAALVDPGQAAPRLGPRAAPTETVEMARINAPLVLQNWDVEPTSEWPMPPTPPKMGTNTPTP